MILYIKLYNENGRVICVDISIEDTIANLKTLISR